MALTTRDVRVVNFLEDTRLIMTTEQIARYFYRSKQAQTLHSISVIAGNRLRVMIKGRHVKRVREYHNQEYIYYNFPKTPKRSQHKLLMSEFLVTMKENNFKMIKVDVEFKELQKDYGLRPDMRIEFEYYQIKFVAFIEVDHTKTFTNEEKYKKLIRSRKTDSKVAELLSDNFLLISVCDRKPEMKGVQWIKSDMSNFTKFKYDFDQMVSMMLRN